MKMIVMYDRVPEVPFLVLPKKGKPHPGLLYRYSKKYGFEEWPNSDVAPYTRGGATTVFLLDESNGWMLSGRTVCSMSDNFSYKEGRERALLRATNLGLGHNNLDSGIMYRMDALKIMDDKGKSELLQVLANWAKKKDGITPNTMYFHPETAEIMPKIDGITTKTSKIILKNHVWIGFEE